MGKMALITEMFLLSICSEVENHMDIQSLIDSRAALVIWEEPDFS